VIAASRFSHRSGPIRYHAGQGPTLRREDSNLQPADQEGWAALWARALSAGGAATTRSAGERAEVRRSAAGSLEFGY
jgi:hypothetical protein